MFKRLSLLFILHFTSSVTLAEDLPAEIISADKLYELREDHASAFKALEIYDQYLKSNPNSVEALWRASMANYYVGHLEDDKEKRLDYHDKGVKQGKRCHKLADKSRVECIFWYATNKILYKKDQGTLSLAFGLSNITGLFKLAAKIDPTYARSGPYRMLSLIYRKLPGFLGGDNSTAYKYINKARDMFPNEPLNLKIFLEFLVEDHKSEQALKKAKEYLSNHQLSSFTYLESKNAYKDIQTLANPGKLLRKD